MNIHKHIPARDCVLVKLPNYTEKLLRKDEVLTISTLNQIKYHPTKGEVVAMSSNINNNKVVIGDTVYFEKLHWEAAKEAAFDSISERDKGIYFAQEVYALHENDTFYMVLPYRFLYLLQRPHGKLSEFRLLNDYSLCIPVAKQEDSSVLKIADLREEEYALNTVRVSLSKPDAFAETNSIAFTLPHCDICLEEPINAAYPENIFIIESSNILCKLQDMKYIASPNRIVIELIPQPEDEEQILKIDSEFANCQMAKVISAGTGVECKEGETIVFPRNAGRKNKLPILPGMTVQYEVIGGSDYFTTIKE